MNEERLPNGGYRIIFGGNAYNTLEDANLFVLTRAAELTVQNGFEYFSITGWTKNVSQTMVHGGMSTQLADKPYSRVVAVFLSAPEPNAFSARSVLTEADQLGLKLEKKTKEALAH